MTTSRREIEPLTRVLAVSLLLGVLLALGVPATAGDRDNVGGYTFKIYGEEDSGIAKPAGPMETNSQRVGASSGSGQDINDLVVRDERIVVWLARFLIWIR